MDTLYVTDLDGTLLNTQDALSQYTIETIERLVREGMRFSYATARSFHSASVVTKGLTIDIPVIIYNGTFILNGKTRELLHSFSFALQERADVIAILKEYEKITFTYAFINGQERVSWIKGSENEGVQRYISQRRGDERLRPVKSAEELFEGDIFYFTCIGEKEELEPINARFKEDKRYNCIFQQELYREEYWFEIMPGEASKGNAILKLKELLGCERIVSFGDGVNDLPMFRISDECYAVENAVPKLKQAATGVIRSNNEDGVARFLAERWSGDE